VSRVLVVVPPLVGHVNPTVSLGGELAARGHDVAWAGLPGVVDRLLPPDAELLPVVGGLDQAAFDSLAERSRGLRGPEALKFLWEDFIIPFARATAPELAAAAARWAPDVLVVDQQAVAGAVVARQAGLPWATSATTSAELTDPLAALPRVDAWVRRQLTDLQVELGIEPAVAAQGDLRFSDQLVLAFTTRALVGSALAAELAGPAVHFVGPSLGQRPEDVAFPWDWLDPTLPAVLVSLGTLNAEMGERFLRVAVEALAGERLQAVVVAPPELVPVPAAATNVLVRARVPQLALLPHLRAVVCHGGHNTVCEALAHGLPLVVAPIRDDQPIVAEQVVQAGAGVRVRFARVRPPDLAAAVDQALHDPGLAAGAARIQASFAAAGGPAAAADAVESLLVSVVR
jgi:MGT family glycosyltransferase